MGVSGTPLKSQNTSWLCR